MVAIAGTVGRASDEHSMLLRRSFARAPPVLMASNHGTASSSPTWMLDPSWSAVLRQELQTPSFEELQRFVEGGALGAVMPPIDRQFAAFASCKFDEVSVVILGQDPYPTPGHANGLAFSVPRHVSRCPAHCATSTRNCITISACRLHHMEIYKLGQTKESCSSTAC